jgi:DNA-binding beta-propeller fold protein YncE
MRHFNNLLVVCLTGLALLCLLPSCRAQAPPAFTISTVAGQGGVSGYSGDGGPATSAELAGPFGIVVDSQGNLYIADQFNNRIRKVSNGTISNHCRQRYRGIQRGRRLSHQR